MRAADTRDSNVALLLAGLLAALVVGAWLNRFIQDDAFISFQYARNLVEGHGLTFNPGERVEGYTNFLWTLMIAAGIRFGFDAVSWSYALGLAFFTGSLAMTYVLARDFTGSEGAGLVAVLLTGGNFTFSAYATGGLETQSQAFFVVAAVWLSFAATRASGVAVLAAASAAYGLALMTRLDSAVCLMLPGLLTLATVARRGSGATRLARVGALLIPGTLLVAPWLAWKVAYYGGVLPNTFYVKVSSAASWVRGGHYVYRFLASYWLLPLVLVALAAFPKRVAEALRRDGSPWGTTLLASISLWCVYVASVGGDFMEFRFIVPVLPLIAVVLVQCLFVVVEHRRLRVAIIAVLMVASALHGATFWGVRDIESINSLAIHMEPDGGDWDEVGRTLGEHFEPESGVSIAVGPAGAIPYYSRLPAVDMRGLVDPWVARNGIIVSTVPGHQRMSPLGYLVDRGVTLVVGHPQVIPQSAGLPEAFTLSSLGQFGLVDASPETVPPAARVLAVPMSGDRWVLVLYLVPHPVVERAVAANGWVTIPLDSGVRAF